MNIAEQQALLEKLTREKAEALPRISDVRARMDLIKRQAAQANEELKKVFGTDDLVTVKSILEKMKGEQESKLLACQEQMDVALRQLTEMEAALTQADGATS